MSSSVSNTVLMPGKKFYFASDFHLGAPNKHESLIREKKVVSWLSDIKIDAQHVFILGDVFDFWFEYKYVIPKGFTRLLGKLMELRDAGIKITIFTGNHDMWMLDYFKEEFNIQVYRDPLTFTIHNKIFMIGHGDGLGPGDNKYKFIKSIFENKHARWVFRQIHPDLGFRLANYWSRKSRNRNLIRNQEFFGEDEWLLQFCRIVEQKEHHDFYVFGHRHLPLEIEFATDCKYINLGDWISTFTFGIFDGQHFRLKKYND